MSLKTLTVCLAGLCLCLQTVVHGQNTITINDSVDQYIFTFQDLSYLEDRENSLSIKDVLNPAIEKKFIPNTIYSPHNTNTTSTYWVRLRIKDNPSSSKKW